MEAAWRAQPSNGEFWFVLCLALITLLLAFAVQRPWLKWTGISFPVTGGRHAPVRLCHALLYRRAVLRFRISLNP
jgi:hypothetical protein